jgi:hypothetical protein
MRKTLLLCALPAALWLIDARSAAPTNDHEADQATIRAIIAADDAGKPDARIAPNLDWENAFGVRYTEAAGREKLLHYVSTNLQAHATSEVLETKIAFLDPATAVADEYWHVAGQIDQATNKPGADRWGRTTFIFRKTNSAWSLVTERIADLRLPYYRHYTSLPKPAPVPRATLASYTGPYLNSAGKLDTTVTLEGDHLRLLADGDPGIGIPTSPTDFVVFSHNDLERYYTVHFAAAGTRLEWSLDRGRLHGVATKVK